MKKFYKVNSKLAYVVTGSTYLHGTNLLNSSWTARVTSNETCSSQKCCNNSLLIVSFKIISKITVRSSKFILCWEMFFPKRTGSIQSHPCWIMMLDGTMLLNDRTNTKMVFQIQCSGFYRFVFGASAFRVPPFGVLLALVLRHAEKNVIKWVKNALLLL